MFGEMVPRGSPSRTSMRESVPVAARKGRTPAYCENTNAPVLAKVVRINSRRFMPDSLPYEETGVNDFWQGINIRLPSAHFKWLSASRFRTKTSASTFLLIFYLLLIVVAQAL